LSKTSIDKTELLNLSRAKRALLNRIIGDILDFEKSKNAAKKAPAKTSQSNDLLSGILDPEDDDHVDEEKSVKLMETKTKRRKTEQVKFSLYLLIWVENLN